MFYCSLFSSSFNLKITSYQFLLFSAYMMVAHSLVFVPVLCLRSLLFQMKTLLRGGPLFFWRGRGGGGGGGGGGM